MKSNESLTLTGRIDRKTHDVADLRDEYPSWDSMSTSEKLEASRSVEPVDTETVYNVTTDRFHKYFVDNLDVTQTASKDNITTLWLGLGTDSPTEVSSSDTDLSTRTFEKEVTDTNDNGKELVTSTFLDSTEGNDNTFTEVGLYSGNPANTANDDVFMLNHATFAGVTKDSTKTTTFGVTLTFSDV